MSTLYQRAIGELKENGICLIRGEVLGLYEFENITTQWFSKMHLPAIRKDLKVGQDHYTTQVLSNTRLLCHSEAYYRPCLSPPDIGALWCSKISKKAGGETTIVDGRKFYERLPPDLAKKFEGEGIIYESIWSEDRWRGEFSISTVKELTDLLGRNKACSYSINAQNELHLLFKSNPIIQNKLGQKLFINGLLPHLSKINHPNYKKVIFSNRPTNNILWGQSQKPLTDLEIVLLIDIYDSLCIKHDWNDGDLLVFDNHRVMHGREPITTGGERLIYSRFGYW